VPRWYRSVVGPKHGPALGVGEPDAVGVYAHADSRSPIGIAVRVGTVGFGQVEAAAFRLVIRTRRLAGVWVCHCRRFVRVTALGRLCPVPPLSPVVGTYTRPDATLCNAARPGDRPLKREFEGGDGTFHPRATDAEKKKKS
jgi:hypothetical protein